MILGPMGASVAQETLELMRLHGVAPSRHNYEGWLSYRLGRNPALREAIDERIAAGQTFTPDVCSELYERFFSTSRASAQMVLAGEKIARDLDQVLTFLKSAEEKSGDYGKTL